VNVFADAWDEAPYPTPPGWEQRTKALLPPGARARPPALRAPAGTDPGERQLEPGEVVFFPKGPEGAHQLFNESDEPARYLIAASHVSPELIEYPDGGKLVALSRIGPLWTMHRKADQWTTSTASSRDRPCKNRTFDVALQRT
jgi:hypothetical protein